MRELFIPFVLELVDDHPRHLRRRVAYTFHPTVAVWVVEAGGEFLKSEKLIRDVPRLGTKLEAIVGEDTAQASPGGDIHTS